MAAAALVAVIVLGLAPTPAFRSDDRGTWQQAVELGTWSTERW